VVGKAVFTPDACKLEESGYFKRILSEQCEFLLGEGAVAQSISYYFAEGTLRYSLYRDRCLFLVTGLGLKVLLQSALQGRGLGVDQSRPPPTVKTCHEDPNAGGGDGINKLCR
jgi:hypothetical protein